MEEATHGLRSPSNNPGEFEALAMNRSPRTAAVAIRFRFVRRTALTVVGAMAISMVFWLPAARPALPAAQPPTSAKKIAVPLAAMVAGVPGNAARVTLGGGVVAVRPLTTAPDSVCAPIQFTSFGIQWRQRAPSAGRAGRDAQPI